MANNIANKLIVNAKAQTEIKNFLSAIAGIERGETLDIDFEKNRSNAGVCIKRLVRLEDK